MPLQLVFIIFASSLAHNLKFRRLCQQQRKRKTSKKMAMEWEGAFFGVNFGSMFGIAADFKAMTVDHLGEKALDLLARSHFQKPDWQVIPFHRSTLERIVDTRQQREFLEACFNLAQMPFTEDTRDNKSVVRHGAIRVTEHGIEIVQKEYFYGSCRCFAAGPLGKSCQRCWNWFHFDRIYAEGSSNPGRPVHRCIIAGTPLMIMYDDEDHPEYGNYTPDMETEVYNPSEFISRVQLSGSELFCFDSKCVVSNLVSAIGLADNEVKRVLRNMGFEPEAEE
jgi:hypothetical protein